MILKLKLIEHGSGFKCFFPSNPAMWDTGYTPKRAIEEWLITYEKEFGHFKKIKVEYVYEK